MSSPKAAPAQKPAKRPRKASAPTATPAISERRAATRAKLVEAAFQAIAAKGFNGSTLDDIAARAGLTKGAIYDNFESKDELFVAVLMSHRTSFGWPEDLGAGSAREKLRRLGQAVVSDETANMAAPLRAEFLLYTLTHDEMRQRVAGLLADIFKNREAQIRALYAPGEPPIAADKMAILFEALIPGLIYLRSQAPDSVSDDAIVKVFEAFAPQRAKE